jgi:hypothetical protein
MKLTKNCLSTCQNKDTYLQKKDKMWKTYHISNVYSNPSTAGKLSIHHSYQVTVQLQFQSKRFINLDQSETPGAIVEYITDDNNLKAIFFQDETMKSSFRNFPEVILVDATYKVIIKRTTLYRWRFAWVIALPNTFRSDMSLSVKITFTSFQEEL